MTTMPILHTVTWNDVNAPARIFNCISYERASQNWPHMRYPHRLSFANKNKFHSAKNRQDNEAME